MSNQHQEIKSDQLESKEPSITLVKTPDDLALFSKCLTKQDVVSFDAEGVDLSREGTLTLLSIGVIQPSTHIFLFDMMAPDTKFSEKQLLVIKDVCESESVEKIVHDCRQDSDALNAQFGIQLSNVFDTSVWHKLMQNSVKPENLNATLNYYNCSINVSRLSAPYKNNHRYWATRPLTQEMIKYASGDVAGLFQLRAKLLECSVSRTDANKFMTSVKNACKSAVSEFRGMKFHAVVAVAKSRRGRVIGKGGANIRQIERQADVCVSCTCETGFLLLADTQSKLDTATRLISSKANSTGYY